MCDLTVECGLHVGKGEAGESAVRLTRVRGLCACWVWRLRVWSPWSGWQRKKMGAASLQGLAEGGL